MGHAGRLDLRREKHFALGFPAVMAVTFAVLYLVNDHEIQSRLVAGCVYATLRMSSLYLFVIFVTCPFGFFWRVAAINSAVGLIVLFVVYHAYAGRDADIGAVITSTLVDYGDYLTVLGLVSVLFGSVVKYVSRRRFW